jgi:AmmeMemoRadiSam system protein B
MRSNRVFILGPSHKIYLSGCALSTCETYETPIGDLPLDRETIKELEATKEFVEKVMTLDVDENEHSIEMHLPYIRKVFKGYVFPCHSSISSRNWEH